MNPPAMYEPPALTQRKIDIHREYQIMGHTVKEVAEELGVKENTVMTNLLDSYKNDQELDFKRLAEEYHYLAEDYLTLAKRVIESRETETNTFSHEKTFALKPVQAQLSSTPLATIDVSSQYTLLKCAQSQLYYDRFHHLPRPAKQKLVQAGGKYSYTNSRTKSKYSSDPNNPQNNTCSLWEEDGQDDDLNYEKQIIANSQQAAENIATEIVQNAQEDKHIQHQHPPEQSSQSNAEENVNYLDRLDQQADSDQQRALQTLKSGYSTFLTGPAGTGKSHVIHQFIVWLKNQRFPEDFSDRVGITSTTGASAILIGGVTLHSFAGIGLGDDSVDAYVYKFQKFPKFRKRWRGLSVWIIDEISMMSPILWDKLDLIGRKMRDRDVPFGGIQMVVLGDFCQLPTVDDTDFCFQSPNWKECIQRVEYLRHVFRQTDPVFQHCLEKIRIGQVTKDIEDVLKSRMIKPKKRHGIEPTVLVSARAHASNYNNRKIQSLLKKKKSYENYPAKYVYTNKVKLKRDKDRLQDAIDRMYQVEDPLELTIDSQVMVTVNLPELGLVNGSRGVIHHFEDRTPVVKFMDGRVIQMPIHQWSLSLDKKKITKFQYPLRLAWAMTIHKSQGMSLDYVHADLGSIFEFGQAYVVLSRVRSLEGLFITSLDVSKIKAHPEVLAYEEEISNTEQ